MEGGALVNAKNVLPEHAGYSSFPGLSSFTAAVASKVVGAYWAKASDGLYYNFVGTATKLYKLSGSSTWDDATNIGGDYSGVTRWEMARFGDRVIAVSLQAATQAFDMGTDTDFADLAGTPPKAATICIAGDFVVLGNLIETDVEYPNRIRWSGYNDTEWWSSSIQRQSDFQDIYGEGGKIQKLVPLPQGAYIFMERAIHKMSYAGPPIVFRIDEVEPDRGTYAAQSVCWNGSLIFFYSHDGFYQLAGGQSIPISEGKVSQWFRDNCDDPDSLRGAVDRSNARVLWAFKSSQSLTNPDRILVYHIYAKKWSWAEVTTECLQEQAQGGSTLEDLDAILGTDIDANSFTVDDPAYVGGQLRLTAVNGLHELCTFAGTELEALIETSDISVPGSTLFVRDSRVVLEGTNATVSVSIGHRNLERESSSYTAYSTEESTGKFSHRVKGRFIRARIKITGAFRKAVSIILNGDDAGRRG